jgi:hypothetical protein
VKNTETILFLYILSWILEKFHLFSRIRAPSKRFSTRNVFCIGHMIICACGSPIQPKSRNFNWGINYSLFSIQKFHGNDEKTQEFWFWDLGKWPTTIIRKYKVWWYSIDVKNHFARFQLPGKSLKQKNCAPYFLGNTQLSIY